MPDNTQPERQRRYRAKLKQARDDIPALQARIAELEAELGSRLVDLEAAPAKSSPLDKLSPEACAEFDLSRHKLKGETDEEKLLFLVDWALLSLAKKRAGASDQSPASAPAPEHKPQPQPERRIQQGLVPNDEAVLRQLENFEVPDDHKPTILYTN